MSVVIDIHDVAKVYRGPVHALRGIDLRVHGGEIFGLLGPNGAGKSTLVKILMTVIRATRAKGTMLGKSLGHKPTLRRIGYLPEHHRLPAYLTGRQALDFYGALSGVDRATRRERIPALLDMVGISDAADRRTGGYSKGMLQRIGIAQAMVHDPELVLLDEPTDGLDPLGRREIRDVLVGLRERGHTVFLNSHLLSELEMVCNRVAILVGGRVVMQGTLEDLTARSHRYEISLVGSAPDWAADSDGIEVHDRRDDGAVLVMPGAKAPDVQGTIDRLRAEDRVIRSLRPVRESLEDLFLRAVATNGKDDA